MSTFDLMTSLVPKGTPAKVVRSEAKEIAKRTRDVELARRGQDSTEKAILIALHREGGSVDSVDTLAALTSLTASSVSFAISSLVERGVLVRSDGGLLGNRRRIAVKK